MNVKEVKDLIQAVLQSDISEFELEHTGTRLKLKRGFGKDSGDAFPALRPTVGVSFFPTPAADSEQTAPSSEGDSEAEDGSFHIIASPIVGTLYRAPSPGSEPYVKLGDHVGEGSILCIVEAMKLLNEIPSDVAGKVVRIYVESGIPVEFGQKLFAILPQKQG
jgi:acetyl-CoA carboxylase biotin carboxyl carrier protein